MSIITIQCRLVAEEETLRHLWNLMAEKNTPLANEILERLAKHKDFDVWVEKSKIPDAVIKEICDSLKDQEPFVGQPGRFYTSAITLVKYIYKSWLALNKRLKSKIAGKEKWLGILKSDPELEQESNSTIDEIRLRASEILASLETDRQNPIADSSQAKKGKKQKQTTQTTKPKFNILMDSYDRAEQAIEKCAIAYLLKNDRQISNLEEKQDKYLERRRKKEIEIERLKNQLEIRIPKGRDLSGDKWQEILVEASQNAPRNEEEFKIWQAWLLKKPCKVPFPVAYETNEDLKWEMNDKGRLFVSFNGLGKLKFEIYCDKRHLHLFHHFLQDQETKRQSKNQHSSALFALRSGRIGWSEQQGKGHPWNLHRLHLFCSLDTRMLSAQGTEQVIEEKRTEVEAILAKAYEKEQSQEGLNSKQQADVIRKKSTLERISNKFPRPSKIPYQGQSNILVGVSIGLGKRATIAVFNADINQVIKYYSAKQLLAKNNKLLNRQRQQTQRLAHKQHKSQKQFTPNNCGESELGQYIDRLLAKEIIAVAKLYSNKE